MIVLDASALVDVVIRSGRRPYVLSRIRDETVCAPGHQPAEVLSALARLTRSGLLSPAAARTAIDDAIGLDQEIAPITRAHLRRALDLGAGVRVVDGLYVALAEERGCPILTTDRRLARTVTTCEVLVHPD